MRKIVEINYDNSGFDIDLDGTHGEIMTGIAIVIKRLESDGLSPEIAINFIKEFVEAYEHL